MTDHWAGPNELSGSDVSMNHQKHISPNEYFKKAKKIINIFYLII